MQTRTMSHLRRVERQSVLDAHSDDELTSISDLEPSGEEGDSADVKQDGDGNYAVAPDEPEDPSKRKFELTLLAKVKLRRLRPFDKRVITEPEKTGVIYLSTIPPGLNVSLIRQYFSEFGTVGRIYLEPEKHFLSGKRKTGKSSAPSASGKIKRLKFVEGWIEFLCKRDAKDAALSLNNQPVGGKKRAAYHDTLWNIKYLHGFKWTNLTERLAYEKATRQQRLRTEIDQAKRVTNFYKRSVEKSRMLDRIAIEKKDSFKPRSTVEHMQFEPELSDVEGGYVTADRTTDSGHDNNAEVHADKLSVDRKKSFADKLARRTEKNKHRRVVKKQSTAGRSSIKLNSRDGHALSDATISSLFG